MLAVVDDARTAAGDGHTAWSESFNEMFMQVAGVFSNASVRRHGRAYLLGLLSQAEPRRKARQVSTTAFVRGENGHGLIPLTAAEARRLFNLHTRVTRTAEYHQHWSGWRRQRQAAARKSHYARRLRNHRSPL